MRRDRLTLAIKALTVTAMLTLAAATTLASNSSSDPAAPKATIRAAESLVISNSLATGAILNASNLKPGDQATGTVTIGNDGTVIGYFSLSKSDLIDTPGPNGGSLSSALSLTVQDLTTNAVVYNGRLSAVDSVPLGAIGPGEAHTYRFTATLPDTGAPLSVTTGDNLYANSSTSATFDWTATDVKPPDPPSEGGNGGGNQGGGGTRPKLKVVVIGNSLSFRGRTVRWSVKCTVKCSAKLVGTFTRRTRHGKRIRMFYRGIRARSIEANVPTKVEVTFSKKQARRAREMDRRGFNVLFRVSARASDVSSMSSPSESGSEQAKTVKIFDPMP